MGKLAVIPMSKVRENPVAVRELISKESEDYQGLMASIREKGFIGAISVRAKVDPETQAEYFEILDGLHRFNAAKDVGMTEIPASVESMSDGDVLEAQIMLNLHHVETKPSQYAAQLRRILACNPTMTQITLASRLGKSVQWVQARLDLTKITNEDIKHLIDEGKIPLSNAFFLAKLPENLQKDYVERAMTCPNAEFAPMIIQVVKEIKDASKKGKDAKIDSFTPVAHMRSLKEVKETVEDPAALVSLTSGANDPTEVIKIVLAWFLHLDEISIAAQRAKHEAAKKAKEELAAKRAAEKKAKQEAEAKSAAELLARG